MQGADGLSEPEGISLKRVAVVEDFFDIIYSMHVESSAEPGKAPKHAGQKKTYRAIAETYAFLPREAVTRFLMSCTECQKRMHFNSSGPEPKENEPPSPLVSGIIDYNMPLTSTYLKQMKLRVMNSQEQPERRKEPAPCGLLEHNDPRSGAGALKGSRQRAGGERSGSPECLGRTEPDRRSAPRRPPRYRVLGDPATGLVLGPRLPPPPPALPLAVELRLGELWGSRRGTHGELPAPGELLALGGVGWGWGRASVPESEEGRRLRSWACGALERVKTPRLGVCPKDWVLPTLPGQHKSSAFQKDETSVSSEDFDMNDSTWMSADPHLASSLSPSQEERMRSPQNLHSQEDGLQVAEGKKPGDVFLASENLDDSSSESGSGNGSSTLNPSTSSSTQGDPAFPEMNGNGTAAPMDFTATAEDQPINLCDKLPPGTALGTPSYPSDGCGTDGLRSRVKYGVKSTPESPPYSSGSYDSIKTEVSGCPEDLTVGRAPTADDDDDDHDDHEDNDKMNDSEGMDPERLKAFNMFVRLFVDENLDRMVPISKQPKEKIQAIIESCSRQFPEFQERARKRIRTYLKSCRRMKKNGMEMTRPTPPHLTSAMAENILAAACESETRKAAKRMRLEIYQSSQDEPIALDKQHSRDSTAITHSTYSLPASAYSQDPVYVNGGLNYSYRSYGSLSSNLQPSASLQTGNHSNGPTDLSMKGGASTPTPPTPTPPSNSTNRTMPTAQLSPTEISAVRQLIAGYRESAAFLLRSADELENLILQQN
ncbi:hypothetical protein ACRRTK_013445 [Alexandromys fortis]